MDASIRQKSSLAPFKQNRQGNTGLPIHRDCQKLLISGKTPLADVFNIEDTLNPTHSCAESHLTEADGGHVIQGPATDEDFRLTGGLDPEGWSSEVFVFSEDLYLHLKLLNRKE